MRALWYSSAVIMMVGSAILVWLTLAPPNVIVDGAEILTSEQHDALEQFHDELLDKHDIDFRVVTAASVVDIDYFAYDQFRRLMVGWNSDDRQGLLVVYETDQNRLRLEPSAKIGEVYSDDFAIELRQIQIGPLLDRGQVGAGLVSVGARILQRATTPSNLIGKSDGTDPQPSEASLTPAAASVTATSVSVQSVSGR